jgi:predicted nucleic acid-binding protein
MRVVLDTNVLISALMVRMGNPAAVYRAWQEGKFTLLTCAEQLDEIRSRFRGAHLAI